MKIYRLFLFAFIVCFTQCFSVKTDELIWPIDSSHVISSTFGEPRPGRVHFGIDFKSDSITGEKVFALGNGFITQVRTSPFGYGKALYLSLDNGMTVVYGHLSQFLPDIEERLFIQRNKQMSYDVDLFFKKDEIIKIFDWKVLVLPIYKTF